MAETEPKPDTKAVPNVQLPAETVRRWREIVENSVKAGRDISVLVQQYAEQSFAAKQVSLDLQGARRRVLARARPALERELHRAEAHLGAEPATAPALLVKFYTAQRIDIPTPEPTATATPATQNKRQIEPHHSIISVPEPFLKRKELDAHLAALRHQLAQIDAELPRIDAVLNRGLKNQQAVVQELAAVSKELYRLAQEVVASMPPMPTSTPKVRRPAVTPKGAPDSALDAPEGAPAKAPEDPTAASEPVENPPTNPPEQAASPSRPNKSVPINPLPLAARRLRQSLATPAAALERQAGLLSAGVGMLVKPIGWAATALGHLLGALGSALTRVRQAIEDAWPWRGPPPD